MSASPADSLRLPLLDSGGARLGWFLLSVLPGTGFPLVDASLDPARSRSAPSVRAVEGARYRYEVHAAESVLSCGPDELLSPDDASLRTGRLDTGILVGEVELEVELASSGRVICRIDIAPTKIGDAASFQSMLSDLAALSVEALHQGFSAVEGRLGQGPGSSPRLLYQRFAVLHSLLSSGELHWALAHVVNDPQRGWVRELEQRPAGTPVPGSPRLARSLSRPGHRVPADGPLPDLPVRLAVERTVDTLDTPANRYIRFVLEQWRALTLDAAAATATLAGAPRRRGLRQTTEALEKIDPVLAHPMFKQVGRLTAVPQANTVLLAREGYRQVTAAAALVESTLGLELEIEPFLVSRRSIAVLYEQWTFVKLAHAVSRACGSTQLPDLFEAGANGMSLVLRTGREQRLNFAPRIGGVPLEVTLTYNQTFGAGSRSGSWTRAMRPDATLAVRVLGSAQLHYLHFDAKYRLDLTQALADLPDEGDSAVGGSKREDLLKMHAYRDAIRGSAGAYVLFPGGGAITEFAWSPEEVLPGLGAVPLRPDHADRDTGRLEGLVRKLLANVASDATRYRRAAFWHSTAYGGPGDARPAAPHGLLQKPPADMLVLLGYVRSLAQWDWVLSKGRYNLRSGSRRGSVDDGHVLLDAPLVLLHGHGSSLVAPVLARRTSPWRAVDRRQMDQDGYPDAGGDAYLVADIELVNEPPSWISDLDVGPLVDRGAPRTVTWLDLVMHAHT